LDPNQDSSYSNRGLCYLSIGKYNEAKSDLNKAINLNSKNIKALKRLAHVHLLLAEFSEAEIFLKRCLDVEPEDIRHKDDLVLVKYLKEMYSDLNKAKFILDYKKSEFLSEKLLEKCKECTKLKSIYVESLLHNCKATQALDYMKKNLTDEEKRKEEFEYFLCLAYSYDGK
jgi:tetratricopeptide (TPR) repeat protein